MNNVFILILLLFVTACSPGADSTVMEPADRFVTLAADGSSSPVESANCVRDLMTGLVWESKADNGLHDSRNTYSWFNPEQSHSELDYRGVANGGKCVASACDTTSFVDAVNQNEHCGFHDWRMPSKEELYSLSDLSRGRVAPTAYLDFFPRTQSAEYWTAHDYSFQYDSAWVWSFEYGHDRVDWKRSPKYVRLVRGESADLAAVKE